MRLSAMTTAMVLTISAAAMADVKLPAVISDHMVVQRDKPVAVWGWADAGEKVSVSLGGQSASATAGADGNWSVKLSGVKKGGDLTIKGKNALKVSDVLVGEVWLCSGQSNMAMQVSRAMNFDSEKAAANLPGVRMFITERTGTPEAQKDVKGKWVVCSPETVGGFSATAYFFGRELHKTLGVPVGLLHSSVGGTPIQAWTSREAMAANADLQPLLVEWDKTVEAYDPTKSKAGYEKQKAAHAEAVKKAKAAGKPAPTAPRAPQDPHAKAPSVLFNGMIAGLVPYTIRGAIWYQGEANAGTQASFYGKQMTTMINDWRSRWGDEFYFGWVQLPNFQAPQKEPSENTGWVLVREQMLKTLFQPKTGMAITMDIGEAGNIHPTNKQEAGRRLALWALHDAYGKDIVSSGPRPQSFQKRGGTMILTFNNVAAGLTAKGGELKGFAIAGADQKFVWADAKITAKDTVVVSSPAVAEPMSVRYDWASNPVGNLYNSAGLPGTQFRTDDWKTDAAVPKK